MITNLILCLNLLTGIAVNDSTLDVGETLILTQETELHFGEQEITLQSGRYSMTKY